MLPLLKREMKHLFARGDGGRHNWMNFHASDVPCTKTVDVTGDGKHMVQCYGNLKWKKKGETLRCDACGAEFAVEEKKKAEEELPPARSMRF